MWLKSPVQNFLSDGECREDEFIDSRNVLMGLNGIPFQLAALFH